MNDYIFKSAPFGHQLECFRRSRDMEAFAILFKMGLGKSKVAVDTAAYLYGLGRIDSLVILAPNGVHLKWLKEDIPFSLPDHIEYTAACWQAGNAAALAACRGMAQQRGIQLKILCANIEALSYKAFPEFLKSFLMSHRALVVVDESTRIKNVEAGRTKTLYKLSKYMTYRRILTGSSVVNAPEDLYGQFCFLDEEILGQSYYAFKATYSVLREMNDPVMLAIKQKLDKKARLPQVVNKDADGNPMYRNLDKLRALIAPYSMIVNKEDALDLPPKTYSRRYFFMTPKQQQIYDTLLKDYVVELEDSMVSVLHKMTLLAKLQQIALGFVNDDTRNAVFLHDKPEDNPRIQVLLELLEDIEGQAIIWTSHINAIKQIMHVLAGSAVPYYGEVSTEQRAKNLDLFRSGQVKYLIGTPRTGGIGLNMTNAADVVYYSNSFDYQDRVQSEDRVHRIGQTAENVHYIDIEAVATIDQHIRRALERKQNLSNYIQQSEGIDYRKPI